MSKQPKPVETAGRLGGVLVEIQLGGMGRLLEIVEEKAKATRGFALLMSGYAGPMPRMHLLDTCAALPDNRRETVRGHHLHVWWKPCTESLQDRTKTSTPMNVG